MQPVRDTYDRKGVRRLSGFQYNFDRMIGGRSVSRGIGVHLDNDDFLIKPELTFHEKQYEKPDENCSTRFPSSAFRMLKAWFPVQ